LSFVANNKQHENTRDTKNKGSYLVLVDPFQKSEIGENEGKEEEKKREKKR
jgi:hypothetical protein